MMKSFFKKLAFVMALAMVVTTAAPAANVFAAEFGIVAQDDKTWTIVETVDVEVDEKADFKFVGAPSNWASLGFTWTSSDEEVATVSQAGIVTGVADGVATITLSDKAGEYVATLEVTVGEGEVEEVVDNSFVAKQISDKKVELTFANTEITKDEVKAGLTTYFLINDVEVNYPVYEVKDVKDGVATVESYVLFSNGTTYGFAYGEESAEFTAVIGDVAYITATYKCMNTPYAAYVGENTQVVATLYNAQGIDITNSVKGRISYALVAESTNGDYWPSGTEGGFYFNTAGVSASVKVTYMTGKYDEFYNEIAGPDTTITLFSTEKPKYDIDQTVAPVATLAVNGAYDINKPNTVIALHDDTNTSIYKLVVKMKDNRGNKNVYTNGTNTEGTFTFQSTNNAVLYIDETTGRIMTNSVGDVSVLIKLTTNEPNATPKVVAVVPVSVKAARAASAVTVNQAAAVVSTVTDFNTTTFRFTITDQLGAKIDPYAKAVTCNNENNLPTGATKAPDYTQPVKVEKGVYDVTVTGSTANLPKDANGYTYTFTLKLNNWLTRTFNVTIRKPVNNTAGTAVAISGHKLEFTSTSDIKTSAATVTAFNNTVTLYELSNNVKYQTAPMLVKPASIDDMKVGYFYFTISKDGNLIKDINNTDEEGNVTSLVNTNANGQIEIDLTKFVPISGTGNANLDGKLEVKKDKLGVGNYTVVVYKGLGTGETGVATATTFAQVTSSQLTVTDSQDTMAYIGRNGENVTNTRNAVAIVKNNFKFKLGNATLDGADDYTGIEVVPYVNDISGSVIYLNKVDFYKLVGVDANGTAVYLKYTVNVGDYVTYEAE